MADDADKKNFDSTVTHLCRSCWSPDTQLPFRFAIAVKFHQNVKIITLLYQLMILKDLITELFKNYLSVINVLWYFTLIYHMF